ncbi:MAG: hypothetical protein ACFFD8_01745 [Candidatus Thorarchaeota archaeon]
MLPNPSPVKISDNKLSRIRDIIRAISQNSTLLIYSYLQLFGKSTPSELRQKTELAHASVFRSLALMTKIGLLTKEKDPTVTDRRYRTHYYIRQTLGELLEHATSEGLLSYAQEKNESQVVSQWMQAWETVPLALNQLTTQLMLSMRHPIQSEDQPPCQKVAKIIAFHVAEEGQFDGLDTRLKEFITDLGVHLAQVRRNWKEPLKRPIVIAISVVTLNPEEVCDSTSRMELVKG